MENNVDHPKHYKREKGVECIEEMIEVFGIEAVKNFCLCNIWKYRYRAADKNGEEDLDKSDWYMQKYIELQKGEKKDPPPTVITYTTVDPKISEPLPLASPYKVTCNTNSVKID